MFDTIMWGEAQAANGLTDLAGLAGQNHVASGDNMQLKSTPSPPYLMGFGSVSDTKPQGCALVPATSNAGKPIYGPGSIDFGGKGWAHYLAEIPIKLSKGENIKGQHSTTNVSEGGVVGAHIQYGGFVAPWDLASMRSKYSQIFSQQITITSGAAVTFNSGAVALDTACTDTPNWLNPEASYEILGISSCISAATFGGMLNIIGLPGEWARAQPGIPVTPLSAVNFDPGHAFTKALEPIPFEGDSLPTVGMTASSAGAVKANVVMGMIGGSA